MKPTPNNQQGQGDAPLVIWRLTDAKPGHENQSLGLCNALGRLVDVTRHDIPVDSGQLSGWTDWLTGRFPAGAGLPSPDLIIGAGHRTHLALLTARRAFGGRAVVIMNPSLPRRWFDLCVIPEHDQVTGPNVFLTRGVMNSVVAGERAALSRTLLLMGGVSAHFNWQDDAVISQVERIVRQQPDETFILSNSRRTPDQFMARLADLQLPNLALVPWQQTGPGWVAEQLAMSRAAWVSEDSVSMVYEAITSGAMVGLIDLDKSRPGRVSNGIQGLVDSGWVTRFTDWQERGALREPPGTFNEAVRCAAWMVEQWLIHG